MYEIRVMIKHSRIIEPYLIRIFPFVNILREMAFSNIKKIRISVSQLSWAAIKFRSSSQFPKNIKKRIRERAKIFDLMTKRAMKLATIIRKIL